MDSSELRVGIVGVAGRGRAFADLFRALPDGLARVAALCDINNSGLANSRTHFPDTESYSDYRHMLENAELDAVIVATPMHLHAQMSVAALDADINVLSEVPAAVSMEESRSLVAAAIRSDATYGMAENYLFTWENRTVAAIAHAGFFGTLTYGRGEYLHELKALNEQTPWRRIWQTGVRGITYPTHSLGPLLRWMGWPRVLGVACAGTGSHYRDPRGEPYHDDSSTMLCHIDGGASVALRVDMISDRPHAMQNYELQGTDGVYESGRGADDDHGRVWIRALDPEPCWRDVTEAYALLREQAPDRLGLVEPAPDGAGHGGGDFFVLRDFLLALRENRQPVVDIHRAMDLTLPGLVSQEAISEHSWASVPNTRGWNRSGESTSVQMLWPEKPVPAAPPLPDGYELGQLRDDEREQYVALMQLAGFADWSIERFAWVDKAVLPDGIFVIRRTKDQRIVATALAAHRPTPHHRWGGELGWVAAHPDESGKGFGRIVCVSVLKRFADAGYHRIYLSTDTFRLPALSVYLRLGFEPFVRKESEVPLWEQVYKRLNRPAADLEVAGQTP